MLKNKDQNFVPSGSGQLWLHSVPQIFEDQENAFVWKVYRRRLLQYPGKLSPTIVTILAWSGPLPVKSQFDSNSISTPFLGNWDPNTFPFHSISCHHIMNFSPWLDTYPGWTRTEFGFKTERNFQLTWDEWRGGVGARIVGNTPFSPFSWVFFLKFWNPVIKPSQTCSWHTHDSNDSRFEVNLISFPSKLWVETKFWFYSIIYFA